MLPRKPAVKIGKSAAVIFWRPISGRFLVRGCASTLFLPFSRCAFVSHRPHKGSPDATRKLSLHCLPIFFTRRALAAFYQFGDSPFVPRSKIGHGKWSGTARRHSRYQASARRRPDSVGSWFAPSLVLRGERTGLGPLPDHIGAPKLDVSPGQPML